MDNQPPSRTSSRKLKIGILIPILLVLLAITATACVIFYKKYSVSQNNDVVERRELLEKLSKVIDLPGSEPAIVTVADRNKLSNKTLADRVKDKDLLLVYGKDRRIIVYRPSSEKVVDMLSFSQDITSTSSTSTGTTDSSKSTTGTIKNPGQSQ